jgi:hypothetical protein
MNSAFARHVVVLIALFVAAHLRAADAPPELGAMANRMFAAIEKNGFDQFVADGDNQWRRLQRGEFDRLTSQLRPKLKDGYEVAYLGQIKRIDGVQQTLWKLTLKNGEELLANIDMKDGKVVRFGVPRI